MPSKKKKNCPEGDIGTYRGEGVKKYPLFSAHQKGDIFFWRERSKSFCHMSHVHFCVSVSQHENENVPINAQWANNGGQGTL